jgi:hypothetical protein
MVNMPLPHIYNMSNMQFTHVYITFSIGCSSSPVSAFHNIIVPLYDPDTMFLPSGENATQLTGFLWPCRGGCSNFPVSAFHKQIVLSYDPDTMHLPFGDNAIDQTGP